VAKRKSYIVSGGGTGGHIYPALAIANAIKKLEKDADILFVGAKGKMEMEKVPKAGYPIKGLWISGLQRGKILVNLLFPLKMLISLLEAFRIILTERPTTVIGTGGFASGPMALMATWMGVPVYVQEQNSYPGITNKQLAKFAKKVFVAYPEMERFFPKDKVVLLGNPIREDLNTVTKSRKELIEHFGLVSESKKTLLVLGGSLGARAINNFWKENIEAFVQTDYQILWQCGTFYYKDCSQFINQIGNPENVSLQEFIYDMPEAYAVADLVISRAGALSISELSAAGKPVIYIPSPNVAENHQYKNAEVLSNAKAAILLKEKDIKELYSLCLSLLKDEDQLETLSINNLKMARAEAASAIAKIIVGKDD